MGGRSHVGLAFNVVSGAPLTPLAANANYDNGGEIPVAPRGSGIQTVDGFRTRTPVLCRIEHPAAELWSTYCAMHMAAQRQLIWRLSSASSGQINECHVIDHSPISCELRIVQVPQSLTTTSSRYADTESAMNTAAIIGNALRNDGWIETV